MQNQGKGFLMVVLVAALLMTNATVTLAMSSDDQAKVNINKAGVAQLQTLPGVGEKVARRIIVFREKHGPFKRVEDLMKVKGIGEKTFLRLKDRITV